MEIPPLILQILGSLVAILALAGLARALGLGTGATLTGDDEMREVAADLVDGFVAERVSIARGGAAALAKGADGRIMLIKRHGNKYAGRLLSGDARVREEVDALIVDCGDRTFGSQRLSLNDPGYWADAINRL